MSQSSIDGARSPRARVSWLAPISGVESGQELLIVHEPSTALFPCTSEDGCTSLFTHPSCCRSDPVKNPGARRRSTRSVKREPQHHDLQRETETCSHLRR